MEMFFEVRVVSTACNKTQVNGGCSETSYVANVGDHFCDATSMYVPFAGVIAKASAYKRVIEHCVASH
jgi:hypothetical protein